MKEEPLPKTETIGQLVGHLFMMRLTRHNMVGYVTGLDRSRVDTDNIVSHIYKGQYDDLEKGMCKRAYNKNGGFSIFRNNVTKGICRICLRNTFKELSHAKN